MKTLDTQTRCCLPSRAVETRTVEIQRVGNNDSSEGRITPRTESIETQMISMSGGEFCMGADDSPYPQDGEGPVRHVCIDPFQIAATAVTISEFAEFVSATGYRTVAETLGTSFVFYAFCDSEQSYPAPTQAPWWRQVPGASWLSPNGTSKHADKQSDHPVTHIAHTDALAYCLWSNTRLPTEAEWEFAARGPLVSQPFPWGNTLEQDDKHRANVWQGEFPKNNTIADGFAGTAPVDTYGPQGFGHYNMVGNVWEWVSDRFTNLHSPRLVTNPKGPLNGLNLVAKGGSYLCHDSYCTRYRTSSRQSLPADTTTGNLGFRVAKL